MKRREQFLNQRKSMGQVFLNTDWPARRVVEKMEAWRVTRVLEIGPGGGILTGLLLKAGIKVTAVEKDERFAQRLRPALGHTDEGALRIVNEDILKFNLPEWIKESDERTAVVGNIPYNISSPILLWVLPYLSDLVGAQFLVQLEFGARLAAAVDTKDYGSLSVFTQLRATVEMDCKVERTCFTPVPKVDSALISLRPRRDMPPTEILKRTESITRAAFTQRRKKLRNGVKPFLKGKLEEDCPIDLNRRAETLSPEEFTKLAGFLFAAKPT